LINPLPPSFGDRSPREIDSKLWTLTARRPLGEWVFADAAQRDPRVVVRRNVHVRELLTGTSAISGTPHVVGVRTSDGEELRADLVIDGTGRQSRALEWLKAIGARPAFEEGADSGFVYYTRYFRNDPQRIAPTLTAFGTFSLLTLPGDNGASSVTIFAASGDQPLKSIRHQETFMNVVRACPLHAHWVDGEPLTDVLAMGGVVDRYRRFVVDGAPVVTGFVAAADAWACTNPSAGRGLTVGLLHARLLRDVLRTHAEPQRVVEEFDRRTESEMRPWYDAQRAVDRMRFAEMDALREGRKPPQPDDPLAIGIRSLFATMAADPDLFRAALEYIGTITPVQQILERPVVRERIRVARDAFTNASPPPIPGPSRQQLLAILEQ
jgi:2-polyprenyl-6-methoxyphenol hydroxylase-like FAD-dependent oxidoreductase